MPIADPDPKAGQKSTRAQGRAAGAARFVRGEGACYGAGSIYFNATTGGRKGMGQVWRLTPSTEGDRLELWVESQRKEDLELPDNIVYAPSGDLIICEDGPGSDRLVGITPAGRYFDLALVRNSESEVAGVTFAPDGRTLFFNIQEEGLTIAVTGPFRTVPTGSGPTVARALPPQHLEPWVPSTIASPHSSEATGGWRRQRCIVWGCRWRSLGLAGDESITMSPPSAIPWYNVGVVWLSEIELAAFSIDHSWAAWKAGEVSATFSDGGCRTVEWKTKIH